MNGIPSRMLQHKITKIEDKNAYLILHFFAATLIKSYTKH